MEFGQEILSEEAAVVGPASAESCLECLQLTREQCESCCFSLCYQCILQQNDRSVTYQFMNLLKYFGIF